MDNIGMGRKELLRALPAVNSLIHHPQIRVFMQETNASHELMVTLAQEIIEIWRERIFQDRVENGSEHQLLEQLSEELRGRAMALLSPHLRKVINGTGVVLHTNLGRAVLSEIVAKQILHSATHYSNLEYNIAEGKRGSRHSHVEELICRLTGAEAAMVVNNNAAAVFLILHAMARTKKVIVSRGQLVEIGGSFRVSEIMRESGSLLVEVGTTNKTHLYDYEQAIDEDTALLMKVHASNFRTMGFTSSVSLAELVTLGGKYQIPVYEDLGSGALYDLQALGIGDEPLVSQVIATGADIVSFSGDKLLGGPQAGIIAGKQEWIDKFKKSQLARVLRVDKMTLAGLDATLRLYLQPEQVVKEIPTLRDILSPIEEIESKADRFVKQLIALPKVELEVLDDESAVGGGTLPGVTLPTKVVALTIQGQAVHQVEEMLRLGSPSVIVRMIKNRILLDFRTIKNDEIEILAERIKSLPLK